MENNTEIEVKKVAPHWRQIVKIQPYFTVVRPFYRERGKDYITKVLNENGEVIEKHNFKEKEDCENKFRELLTQYR